jgi:hypothetical protein
MGVNRAVLTPRRLGSRDLKVRHSRYFQNAGGAIASMIRDRNMLRAEGPRHTPAKAAGKDLRNRTLQTLVDSSAKIFIV